MKSYDSDPYCHPHVPSYSKKSMNPRTLKDDIANNQINSEDGHTKPSPYLYKRTMNNDQPLPQQQKVTT